MKRMSASARNSKAPAGEPQTGKKRRKGWKIAVLVFEVVLLAAAVVVLVGLNKAASLWERLKSHTEDDPFNQWVWDDPFYQPGSEDLPPETADSPAGTEKPSDTEKPLNTEKQAGTETPAGPADTAEPGKVSESSELSGPSGTDGPASSEETQQTETPAESSTSRPLPTIVVPDETGGTEVISLDVTKPTANEIESHVQQQMRGYLTFVVFGVDARNNKTLLRLTQGDVCMIISLNRDTGEVRIASVYRDTWLEGTTDYARKLTDVYCNLGASRTMLALNCNYDLEITDFVVVNWKVVAEVVNMLGGLDIELTEKECYALNGEVAGIIIATGIESTTIENVAGVHHLDGVQTVAYARIRKVGNADYQRTERQRLVVGKMLEKVKNEKI